MGFAELIILIGVGVLFTGAIFLGVYSDIKKNKKIKEDAQRQSIKQAPKTTTKIDNLPKKVLEREDVFKSIDNTFQIRPFNNYMNSYRDIVNRLLLDRGVNYTYDMALELQEQVKNCGRSDFHLRRVAYKEEHDKMLVSMQLSTREQHILEAFEYDLIVNNEANSHRVNIIKEVLDELSKVVKEKVLFYDTFANNFSRDEDKKPNGKLASFLSDETLEMFSVRKMLEHITDPDTISKLLEFKNDLIKGKYSHNLFIENMGIFEDDTTYIIQKEVGYDKYVLNVAFVLFCYLKRDEILEVFYSRASKGVTIQDKAREAHTYIIGASKSGKSELIKDLIFSDFQRGNKSVILIEPHGDLAEQVAKLKDKDNKNLVYIDFSLDPTKTPILNPFDISDRSPENIEIQAQALIDAFEDILGAEFSTQMEELLGATIRTLMTTGKGDFWELRRFMDDENNSDLVTAGKASPNPKDRLFFNDGSFNQQSYKPTKNSLKSKIGTYLGYAVFRNFTTGKSTIDLKKLTDGKKWVIFNLSKGNIGKKVSPILGRFVIASLQNIILQRAKTTHRTPVYLYIDEFQNYTSETIEEIFSESRKYGFHLTVAHQNTGQLLGKMKDLIFSNTSVKIVGRNDTEQLKKLSNQILTEFEELDKLTTGNFYMRVEKNEAQKIKVGTKLIDNKYSMTPQEWEQVKAEQLSEYYEKIQQREPPTISEPESEKFDFNPSDTV